MDFDDNHFHVVWAEKVAKDMSTNEGKGPLGNETWW